MVVPYYACRLGDLADGGRIQIDCSCGRRAVIDPETIRTKPWGAPIVRVDDMSRFLRCSGCGERRKLMLSVIWASPILPIDQPGKLPAS